MNILIVWDGDYPWDIRVDKIATSLNETNHNVNIACRNLARQELEGEYRGSTLYRLSYLPKWLGKLNDLYSFPAFFSPLWIRHIYRSAKKSKAELIIARDLPMAIAAIWVARKLKIPCVLDMAECYPEMLRCIRQFEGFKFKNLILRNPSLADMVESYVFKHIDEVWAMIEESEAFMISKGVPANKIRIVSNTPKYERFELKNFTPQDDKFRLIYVGLLNPSRGVKVTIEAAAKYYQENNNFELIIVGSGKDFEERKKQVETLKAGHYIKFLGWVDNDKIPELIGASSVGIVPHFKCAHWDNTIPNKLFDYMAAERAVIVSDVDPMARIVRDCNCGLVYKNTDSDSLVISLRELADPKVREPMAKNGRNSIENRYNWQHEEAILLESIANFEQRSSQVVSS